MGTLVTGATGFIGKRLMRDEYCALVRRPSGLKNEFIGDLLNPSSLEAACRGIHTIFHCAGHAHALASDNKGMHEAINHQGTKNLLNAAGLNGVRRFIFLSSVKAMAEPGSQCVDEKWTGAPMTPYGKAKLAAERSVLEAGEKYGMHVVNLRLAMVYGLGSRGNLHRMIEGLRAGWFPRIPETGNRRSLVHVSDVVRAIQLASQRPEANGRTYIVADHKAYSSREICEAILSLLPNSYTFSVPTSIFRLGGIVGDLLGKLSSRQLPISSEVVSRLLDSECYSPARIEHELGWRSNVNLIDGLREMIARTTEAS